MILEKIYARCTEDGDCLVWTGPANNYRHPTLSGAAVRRAFSLTQIHQIESQHV